MRYAEKSPPSHFALGPHLVEPSQWRQNLHSDLGMANMQREESKHEKLERQQREREQMRQAIAAKGRMSGRRIDRRGPVGHEPDPRFAYLTRLHD